MSFLDLPVLVCFAFLPFLAFLEGCISPPLPQPLSTPAGAERGANSRIWLRFFRGAVHARLGVGRGGFLQAWGFVGTKDGGNVGVTFKNHSLEFKTRAWKCLSKK